MVNYADVLSKLKEEKEYTLFELANKEKTKIPGLKNTLLKILHNEIASIPLNNDVEKYKYIYKIFKYLDEPSNEYDKERITENLEKCKNICYERIKLAKKSKNKKNNTKVLYKIIDILDITILNLQYYDSKITKEIMDYDLLFYLIFKVQNYTYLFEIIKTYPDKCKARNKEGKYLVEELIDKYLCEMLINENSGQVIYIEKVIKLFMDKFKQRINNSDIIKIVNRLNNSINEINSLDLLEQKKQKIIFFINEIILYIDSRIHTAQEILNVIKDIKNNINIFDEMEKSFVIYYLDRLIEIIDKNEYNVKTIEQINSFISNLDKLNIDKSIKREIKDLTNVVVRYLSNNIATNQMYDYLNYKYNIDNSYGRDVLDEAKNTITINNEKVLDCTNKFTFTIDGARTMVYDDAISFETFNDGTSLLSIYLADCASFIPRDSLIDNRALSLGETVRARGQYYSMIVPELVDNLTLKKSVNRRAIGYFFLFDKDLKCIDFKVRKCLIKVSENYDYEKANMLLSDSRSIEEIRTLKGILMASKSLGKLDQAKEEFRKIKQLKRTIIYEEKDSNSVSAFMIADLMVYLNSTIANYFAKHPEIPFIYRNNLSNYGKDIIREMNDIISSNYDYDSVISYINALCPPSFYSIENIGHNGLNLKAYCHATNPLRNYCSLEIQRMIEKYIINKDMHVTFDEARRVTDLCDYLNSRMKMNDEYVNELNILDQKQKKLTK